VAIPFVPRIDDEPRGVAHRVAPLIERVIADNPGKFTYHGTGTYILGTKDVVVIDPGPRMESHRIALETALKGRHVAAIVVTHCHSDHSPLSAWLHEFSGAPRYAIGPHRLHEGWVEEDDHDPSEDDDASGGSTADDGAEERETVDLDFAPDVTVVDGDIIVKTGEFTLTAVATPGHTSNHLCVAMDVGNALFTGDHVMGWSTTIVAPPDGDMADYMASLRKVIERHDSTLWPTHGGPVTDPTPYLTAYLGHRLDRERRILEQVRAGNDTIGGIVKVLYVDIDKRLHRAARRSVWSHLRKLMNDGMVTTTDGGHARLFSTYEVN
jgi:glyoxylase-like metal-dependent hydrolase (beta-lactamase superfamily II)